MHAAVRSRTRKALRSSFHASASPPTSPLAEGARTRMCVQSSRRSSGTQSFSVSKHVVERYHAKADESLHHSLSRLQAVDRSAFSRRRSSTSLSSSDLSQQVPTERSEEAPLPHCPRSQQGRRSRLVLSLLTHSPLYACVRSRSSKVHAAGAADAAAAARRRHARARTPQRRGVHRAAIDSLLAGRSSQEKAAFFRRVTRLMKHPKTIATFAQFDLTGEGTIDTSAVTNVLLMLDPTPSNAGASAMLAQLDMDDDNRIDCWEFCIFLQLRYEQAARDRAMSGPTEMDVAFDLFDVDADDLLGEEELRRVFQLNLGAGSTGLTDAEFEFMLKDLGLGPKLSDGGSTTTKISLSDLRQHPAFADDDEHEWTASLSPQGAAASCRMSYRNG
ncbi:hypothetical protein AB1Y20_014502 [Prymnesium parvum]|uniref:EF-hand domain-containing protein n=1 Tax=Prymnesium parvum TaxID=97485 RepID=A0AB34IEJ4_PRYPA